MHLNDLLVFIFLVHCWFSPKNVLDVKFQDIGLSRNKVSLGISWLWKCLDLFLSGFSLFFDWGTKLKEYEKHIFASTPLPAESITNINWFGLV